MIKNDIQLGKPKELYTDTKANIEAIGSPVAGMMAFASDENRPLYYGSAWKLGLLSDFDNDGFYWDSSNSKLGIGTDSPSYNLHIVGTSKFTSTVSMDAALFIYGDTAYPLNVNCTTQNNLAKFTSGDAYAVLHLGDDTTTNTEFVRRLGDVTSYYSGGNLHLNLAGNSNVMIGTSTDGMTSGGSLAIAQDLAHRGTKAGFMNTSPITKPTVSGSRGGNAALASLLTALANYGLITNSTSA